MMREVYRWVGHLGNLPLDELVGQNDSDRMVLELAQQFRAQYLVFAEGQRQ